MSWVRRRLCGRRVEPEVRPHLCHGGTFYRWRNEYGGQKIVQPSRIKEQDREIARLRPAVSDLTLDKLTPEGRAETSERCWAASMHRQDQTRMQAAERRVCPVLRQSLVAAQMASGATMH